MSKRKKKNRAKTTGSGKGKTDDRPIGTFISVEPNIKPKKKAMAKKAVKKKKTDNKKSNNKNSKTPKASKSKKVGTKTTTKSKTKNTKNAKNDKGKKKKKAKTVDKKGNKAKKVTSPKTVVETKPSPKEANEEKTEAPAEPEPVKKAAFPWSNWVIDSEDDKKTHNTRRSSLGSIRELYLAQAKKSKIDPAPSTSKSKKNKKKSKKKSKKKTADSEADGDEKIDIYDPKALKAKRRKEKKEKKFKVIPKHHVKRSSLPTYQSIRKNNPKLQFIVHKEKSRNLATLLDQPEKRKKSKELKNLSRSGFVIHVNHRYRLEDGRIGVCKFRGRTAFGKSSEDWIGLVLQVGEGEHDGSVLGKTYFRCRGGKGVFVRPYDVVEDMGSQNKMLSKEDIKLAEANIKRWKKQHSDGVTTSSDVITETDAAINPDHGYEMNQEKFYNPKTLLDKNKGKKAKKKAHHTQI